MKVLVNQYKLIMMIKTIRRFFSKDNLTPQKYVEIIKTGEEVISTQGKIQSEMESRIKQLQEKHRYVQEQIDSKIKFPIKLCGTNDKYQPKFSYLSNRVMSYYKIPSARVTDYLLKMYKASIYAIADRNQQYMNEYWEQGLTKKVLKSIDEAKRQNLQMRVQKNLNFAEQIEQSCKIVDSIMIRGLSMNRNDNLEPKQYIKYSESDQVGLLTYTPKIITENNQNFIDPTKNKTVYNGYDKMLMRVLVRIKSPLRLSITQLNVPDDVYTWEHLCVFQNQMAPLKPLESSYKLQTLIQWLGKYRFGPWRIVDMDNYMLGNSPFRNYYPEQVQIDPVFKGTKLDRSSHIDIRII